MRITKIYSVIGCIGLLLVATVGVKLIAPAAEAQAVNYSSRPDGEVTAPRLYLYNFPTLVPVDGFPVYVAQDIEANYFYYSEIFWLFDNGVWWRSTGFNGPWSYVEPDDMPDTLLQVPVQYYRMPPAYFGQWNAYESPLWPILFGEVWLSRHQDWHHHQGWGEREARPHVYDDHDGRRDAYYRDRDQRDQGNSESHNSLHSPDHSGQVNSDQPHTNQPPSNTNPNLASPNLSNLHDSRPSGQPRGNAIPANQTYPNISESPPNSPQPERRVPVFRPNEPNPKADMAAPAPKSAAPTAPAPNDEKKHHPEEHDK